MKIQNLFFAITAQPHRIAVDDNEPFSAWVCLGALVAVLEALWNPGLLMLQVLPLIILFQMPAAMRHKHLVGRALIVCACAPMPALLISTLEVHLVLVMLSTGLAAYTISKAMAPRPDEFPQLREEGPQDSGTSPDNLRRLRSSARGVMLAVGPKIGRLGAQDIPAWFVDERGQRYVFSQAWTGRSIPHLKDGEVLLSPGLIFGRDEDAQGVFVHTNPSDAN